MIELDSLHVGDLKIYRDTETFAYGTDSVVLAYFAGMKKAPPFATCAAEAE